MESILDVHIMSPGERYTKQMQECFLVNFTDNKVQNFFRKNGTSKERKRIIFTLKFSSNVSKQKTPLSWML